MQDRPAVDELLAAIEHFLDAEIVPNVPGSRGFHARVAANAVRIVRRELDLQDEHLVAEWERLDRILGPAERPANLKTLAAELRSRNEALCARIRDGHEDDLALIAEHVRETVRDKLRTTNPELLSRSAPLDRQPGVA